MVNTISGQVLDSNEMIRTRELISNVRNEIKCSICENSTFKVERVEPEIFLLICENCGEIHEVTPEIFSHKMLYLRFCKSGTLK